MIYCDGIYLMGSKLDELHEFAETIGLRRNWFQNHPAYPHYKILKRDIRTSAFRHGATSVTSSELIQLMMQGRICRGSALSSPSIDNYKRQISRAARACGMSDLLNIIIYATEHPEHISPGISIRILARDKTTGKFVPFKTK